MGPTIELAQVDLKEKAFRTLFPWQGKRLVTISPSVRR